MSLFSNSLFSNNSSSSFSNTQINSKKVNSQLNLSSQSNSSFRLNQNMKYKNTMEDYVKVIDKLHSINNHIAHINYSLYCLFDGHGGKEVAEYTNTRLPDVILKQIKEKSDETLCFSIEDYALIDYEHILKDSIRIVNSEMKYFVSDTCGSTVSIVLIIDNITKSKQSLVSSNLGDSRIVLVDLLIQSVKVLSEEHLLSNQDEVKRILNSNGKIESNRVGGSLIVTRSIGDHFFLKYGLSNEPFVSRFDFDLVENHKENQRKVLIIASDGVWDVIQSSQLLDFIDFTQSSQELCKRIEEYSINNGSRDNISCIVVKV